MLVLVQTLHASSRLFALLPSDPPILLISSQAIPAMSVNT